MASSATTEFDASWSAPGKELVLRAIERHGGALMWERLESVSVSLVSLAGWLPRLKGYRRTFELANGLTAFPKSRRVEFWQRSTPFESDARNGERRATFENGTVMLLHRGAIERESRDHRQRFRGLTKLARWSELDAYYFFGYAFVTYTRVPFTLPSLRFHGLASGEWNGEQLAGVDVEFERGSHVHSLRQRFFFDHQGLLRRMDYVADVVGGWAHGAHGCDDYRSVGGLAVPARRRVVPRLGMRLIPAVTVLEASFDRLEVTLMEQKR